MRFAVFSDIHGNIFAFEKAYDAIKREKCDVHLCLGDLCGYYYFPEEVIALMRTLPNLTALQGNHDRMFLTALNDGLVLENYTRTYGRAFEFLKAEISTETVDYLRSLPHEYRLPEVGVAGFHGSPWNPISEYIYPDADLSRFDDLDYKVVFMGHTHYTMNARRGGLRIVNPGSVGQPRDGGLPSFAVYDSVTGVVEIKHVAYDVGLMIDEIRRREDENSYLIEVLERSVD